MPRPPPIATLYSGRLNASHDLHWARQAHNPAWIDAADLTLHAALAAHTAALAARRAPNDPRSGPGRPPQP